MLLRDQFEVAITLMLGIGPELYLVADLGRIHEVACVQYIASLHMVERVGEEGDHGMIDHHHVLTLPLGVGAKLDEHRIERRFARRIHFAFVV